MYFYKFLGARVRNASLKKTTFI